MDLLTRDALILITAEAARKAWITPDVYLNRYFKDSKERAEAERFLWLVELVYEGTERIPVWDARWSLDNQTHKILKWVEDE